jgi:hypothetical protein
VLISFLQQFGEKKLKNVKQEGCKFSQSLFSFLVLKQMQGAQYGSTTRLDFIKNKKNHLSKAVAEASL